MSKEKIHMSALGKANIALGILIIAGIAVNAYQFIGNNSLKSELYTLEAEIEALQNESTKLDTELSSGKEDMANLSSQLEELETEIGNLEANNKSLSDNLEELKATKEVQEETGTDSGSSDMDIVESDIETLDKTMYAQGNVNTRSGPSQDFEKIGGLAVNQEVKVTGQSKETGWYEIEVNGSKQYVSNKFLADSKITVTTSANSSGSAENTQNTGDSGSNGVSASDQAILDSLGATQSTGGWGNTINWGSGTVNQGVHAE